MSTLADRTIVVLRANHDRLASQVRAMTEADLDRPSGAGEWDVAQVLSHLGSAAEIGRAGLEHGLAGADAPDQDFNHSVWDRWNAMSQQEKAAGFLVAGEQLVAAYEALDQATRADLHVQLSWLPFPADVAMLTGMRLNEVAMHGWDVRVAFDPAATVPSDEAAVLLEHLTGSLRFLVGFLGKTAGLDGQRAALRVETTDPNGELGLVVGDAVELEAVPHEIDGTLSAPTEAFLRLVAGRLAPAHTPASVSIASEVVTLEQLRRVFPGF